MKDGDWFKTIGEWRAAAAPRTPLTGALILPVDREGRVLLQLRDYETERFPGLWGFFGGKVEQGETLRAAAVREFHEETGLTLDPRFLIPHFHLISPKVRSNLYVFEARISASPSDIRLEEGAGFAFVAPDDFHRLDMALITETVLTEWLKDRAE